MQKPDFSFEEKYWKQGFDTVIGIDEAGRGPLAGPVIAAAAAMKLKIQKSKIKVNREIIYKMGIDDSKKLTARKRKFLAREIPKYFDVGIGQSSVSEINKTGIVKATEKAMLRAIDKLIARNFKSKAQMSNQIQSSNVIDFTNIFLLVDGFKLKHFLFKDFKNQEAIIKGDGKSISIASASIMAKVYRDQLMVKLASKYPNYWWERNKGYGTELHTEAISKYGITEHHRELFVRNLVKVQSSNIKNQKKRIV